MSQIPPPRRAFAAAAFAAIAFLAAPACAQAFAWKDALFGGVEQNLIQLTPQMMSRAVLAALLLALFWLFSRVVRTMLRKFFGERGRLPTLQREFIINVVAKAVLMFGVLMALWQFGVQIGPLLAGLGIVGIVVGFALQETLSNFAAGIMILIYRPYDEGDYISAAGVTGTVHAMNFVSTTILTVENHRLIVPNNKIWGDIIRNFTSQAIRRVDLVFGVGYEADVEKVERVLHEVVGAHALVIKDPPTVIKLNRLADSAVEFVVRPWVKSADYLDVYWDLQKQVKLAFDRENISIPFPQRHVTLTQADKT